MSLIYKQKRWIPGKFDCRKFKIATHRDIFISFPDEFFLLIEISRRIFPADRNFWVNSFQEIASDSLNQMKYSLQLTKVLTSGETVPCRLHKPKSSKHAVHFSFECFNKIMNILLQFRNFSRVTYHHY